MVVCSSRSLFRSSDNCTWLPLRISKVPVFLSPCIKQQSENTNPCLQTEHYNAYIAVPSNRWSYDRYFSLTPRCMQAAASQRCHETAIGPCSASSHRVNDTRHFVGNTAPAIKTSCGMWTRQRISWRTDKQNWIVRNVRMFIMKHLRKPQLRDVYRAEILSTSRTKFAGLGYCILI
jgi:hypothetical protein